MNEDKPNRQIALIICDVFRDEFEKYAPNENRYLQVSFFEMGLHDNPPKLRQTLQGEIDRIEAEMDVEYIVLAYGLCGGGTLELTTRKAKLVIPKAHDCVSILLGCAQRHSQLMKETPGTYFYSPGWVRGKRVPGPDRESWIRSQYADKYDDEMIDELVDADLDTFEHYTTVGYVDITANEATHAYCQQCARHLNWEFQALQCDSSWWQDLLNARWDSDRFLVLKPGQRVTMGSEGEIMKSCEEPTT